MTRHRQAWIDIDLEAIRNNVSAFRGIVDKEAQRKASAKGRIAKSPALMAVVKADAYGHGAIEVARAAISAGANWLGVATVDEALSLRLAGIGAPLLLLSEPPEEALPALLEADVTCSVATPEFLQTLAGHAMLEHRQVRYHLKVDTGMRRIGIEVDKVLSLARQAAEISELKMEGIFTHFATADVAGDWDARQQFELFQGLVRKLDDLRLRPPLVHACNTAATMLMPQAHFDMVRIGIGLYGHYPSKDTFDLADLTPAMNVRAKASFVKPLAMGDGVGYGLSWRAHKPAQLVTLPLGYADGVPRICSNQMDVLINSSAKRIEQVGRVCMDMLMAAASTGEDIKQGDEFVLMGAVSSKSSAASVRELAKKSRKLVFGKSEGYIGADELAEQAETISYEILCGFGNRLEKVYRNA